MTPQHSKWNCVGTNKPQHMHMHSLVACDWTLNTPKIRIVQNKKISETTKLEFESANYFRKKSKSFAIIFGRMVSINNTFVLFALTSASRYKWSRNDVGSSRSTSFINFFHVGLRFYFLPANVMSTNTGPDLYWRTNWHSQCGTFTRLLIELLQTVFPTVIRQVGDQKRFGSRGTSGSSMLDHDCGYLCRGRRVPISWHSDLGNFNNAESSSILTLV